jgi:hypothetical protein
MVRYQTATVPHKFRGQWMNVNPATWGERSRMMVTVGTGASDDQMKMGALQQLLGVQQQIMQDPANNLVDYTKIYNTLDELTGLADVGEAAKYFYNPMSPEGQQFAQMKQQGQQQQAQEMMQKEQMQLEMQQATVQAQMKVADAEMGKAQATQQNGQLKAQIDHMKNQYTQEIDQLKVALQAAKDNKAQEFQLQNMKTQAALKLTELEIQAKRDLNADINDNKDAINGKANGSAKDGSAKGQASPGAAQSN